MSIFTSPLVVTPMPDGGNWKLLKPFVYHIGDKYSRRFVRVPVGFLTDFASIPWWLWRFFFWWLPLWAKYVKSAILHDYLYSQHHIQDGPFRVNIRRKDADDIFLEAMLVEWRYHKSRYLVAHLEHLAVRLFGWLAWRD